MRHRIKNHILIPALLLVYFGIMAYVGYDNYRNPATRATYLVSLAFELGIIVILFFVLRKRDSMRRRREAIDRELTNRKKEND